MEKQRMDIKTRSSAVAEKPRDVPCDLKIILFYIKVESGRATRQWRAVWRGPINDSLWNHRIGHTSCRRVTETVKCCKSVNEVRWLVSSADWDVRQPHAQYAMCVLNSNDRPQDRGNFLKHKSIIHIFLSFDQSLRASCIHIVIVCILSIV